MNRLNYLGVLLVLTSLLACSGPGLLQGDRETLGPTIEALQRRVAANPGEVTSLRDLGAAYVIVHRTGDPIAELAEAEALLSRANELLPGDGKTLLYLGLAREALGKPEEALAVYQQYDALETAPPGTLRDYQRLLQKRHRDLLQAQARAQIQALAANEQALAVDSLAPTTVGVFAFAYQGDEERYAPIGRGVAELITTDLAKVEAVTVVERVRLQALIDEIQLGQSGAVDVATAPRAGKLLQAGTVVGGTYDVAEGRTLRLNVAAYNVRAGAAGTESTEDGLLADLFRLQKAIVVQVLEQDLGLTLTAEERAAIAFVATENFEAFLAFSRGLVQEDAGQLQAASASFQQAAGLDPGFEMASERATTASELSSVGSTPAQVLGEAIDLETAMLAQTMGLSLTDQRLLNLGTSMGSNFLPSEDNRDGLEEAVGAGGEGVPPSPLPLPDPPPPPPPTGGND